MRPVGVEGVASEERSMRGESDRIKAGDPAPDFALESAAGETLALDSLRGRPIALYFFRGTW